jgi:hypothetical protein
VHGTVRSIDPGRDVDGIPATWITLDVDETLKGPVETRSRTSRSASPSRCPTARCCGCRASRAIASATRSSSSSTARAGRGFTSPVGLGQGLFRAEDGPKGRAVRAAIATGAAEDLPDFLARVRRRAGH